MHNIQHWFVLTRSWQWTHLQAIGVLQDQVARVGLLHCSTALKVAYRFIVRLSAPDEWIVIRGIEITICFVEYLREQCDAGDECRSRLQLVGGVEVLTR